MSDCTQVLLTEFGIEASIATDIQMTPTPGPSGHHLHIPWALGAIIAFSVGVTIIGLAGGVVLTMRRWIQTRQEGVATVNERMENVFWGVGISGASVGAATLISVQAAVVALGLVVVGWVIWLWT
ncbi:hypothetical protein [Haloarcula amylovorans]|uniref:hypothetical protein n=1 Tax=Haloarcula amylovorans TaxID=2562280 RepID=UPI001076B2F1|nr:hypothetical protein [Halomicroarcula amylolytica]